MASSESAVTAMTAGAAALALALSVLPPPAVGKEPASAVVAFVDVRAMLAELGNERRDASQARLLEQANRSLRYLAEIYPVDLVLQDVVYLDRRFDLTPRLVAHAKTNSVDFSKPARSASLTRVAYVDRQRSVRELKAPGLDYVALRKQVDLAVKAVAERFGFDLVIEEAALCGCPIDITADVLLEARGEAPDAARLGAVAGAAAKIGVVDVTRLLKEAKGAPPPDRKEELKAFIDLADGLVRSLAEDEGFDFVLQDAVWASPRVDMTARILDRLGRR